MIKYLRDYHGNHPTLEDRETYVDILTMATRIALKLLHACDHIVTQVHFMRHVLLGAHCLMEAGGAEAKCGTIGLAILNDFPVFTVSCVGETVGISYAIGLDEIAGSEMTITFSEVGDLGDFSRIRESGDGKFVVVVDDGRANLTDSEKEALQRDIVIKAYSLIEQRILQERIEVTDIERSGIVAGFDPHGALVLELFPNLNGKNRIAMMDTVNAAIIEANDPASRYKGGINYDGPYDEIPNIAYDGMGLITMTTHDAMELLDFLKKADVIDSDNHIVESTFAAYQDPIDYIADALAGKTYAERPEEEEDD